MEKRVVVIGGGFSGSLCARKLEKDFKVTLIDSKNYFEFTPSILRTIIEPEHIKKIQVLHKGYLKKSKVITGKVVSVDEKKVFVGKREIPYDYLVIASGSSYVSPIKEKNLVLPHRSENLMKFHNLLEKSGRILIIGGGLVGVELAAEISEHYKDKAVAIVNSGERLIGRNNLKCSVYAEKFLNKRGVEIFNGEVVMKRGKNLCVTNKGREIHFDLCFSCTGIIPNYEFLEKNFSKSFDKRGFVKVNKFLQVEGFNNIFACGDVAGIKEEKTAQHAEIQAKKVIDNIYLLENGGRLSKYISKRKPMVISLGKKRGILEYKNFVLTGLLPGIFKGFIEWLEMRKFR